ncbi:MAG: hydroxyacid dehydrogenase [Candidatus Rokubacteria bacterium 13_1_40CM_4_69_5]|nr:MAG: hydroxyacid dehydrogenase [Candidatus Rokubacteria bacterium 13_1_40CM_4_69_5]
MHRIAILDDYLDVARSCADWSVLEGRATTDVFADHLADEDAVARRLAPYDIVVAERERTPFRRSLIERLPRLRLLVATGPVNWSIDYAAASERGIVVCGTEALHDTTPELTWGLILALCRRVVAEDRGVRAGRWQTGLGIGLKDKALGVIGLGHAGAPVAAIGRAFAMEVLAWSQNLTAERAAAAGATLVTKEELLRRADVVTIHVVLGPRTRGLIGARELALMKPTAYLVNTSRGPIVEERALIEALEGGRLAGAGLDVFDVEPLPLDHPFRRIETVVATPHVGYITAEQYRLFYGQAVEGILAFLDGRPIRPLGPSPDPAAAGTTGRGHCPVPS